MSHQPFSALVWAEVDGDRSDDHTEDQSPTNGFEYTGQAWQVRRGSPRPAENRSSDLPRVLETIQCIVHKM